MCGLFVKTVKQSSIIMLVECLNQTKVDKSM